jgi:uncharacterized protein with ATP-grasp and redox domains
MNRISVYTRGLCEKLVESLNKQRSQKQAVPTTFVNYLWQDWSQERLERKISSLCKKIVRCIVEDAQPVQEFKVLARLKKIKPTPKLIEIVRQAIDDNPDRLHRLYQRLKLRRGVLNTVVEEFPLKKEEAGVESQYVHA